MLYLWMPEGDGPWRWCNDAGARQGLWQTAENWEALLSQTELETATQACVFFPTAAALQGEYRLSRQQVRQLGAGGIRFLLEDFATVAVEQLEVRSFHQLPDQLFVLAVPVSVRDGWLNALGLGRWRIDALLPDFLLLPQPDPAMPSLYCSTQQQLLRQGSYSGMAIDDPQLALPRLKHVTAMQLIGQPDEHWQAALDHADIRVVPVADPCRPPPMPQRHPFNLVSAKPVAAFQGYWKAVALVMLTLFASRVLYDGLSGYRYQQVAQTVRKQAEQQYRMWFPGERITANLRRQVEGHRQVAPQTDPVALKLIARIGPLLGQSTLIKLTQLNFTGQALELTLDADNLAALEQFKSQLVTQGLQAQLGTVSPAGQRVNGLIRINAL